MKTLGRNADNDLYLEAGGLAIVHDAEAQCTIIESLLLTQQGELQFDDNAGIDYFGTILQNPSYIEFWAAQVTSKIEALDFVSSVEDFQYRFDRATSTLYWTMTVVNTDNERLDLQNKKIVLDGSPGIDVSWNTIYDKPTGVDDVFEMVNGMRDEAQEVDDLTSHSTLSNVKNTINRIIYDPNDKTYAESRQVRFDFVGVPLGTILDFSNFRFGLKNTGTTGEPFYAPYIIEVLSISKDSRGNKTENLLLRNRIADGEKYYDPSLPEGQQIVTVTLGENGNELWFFDKDKPSKEVEGVVYYQRTYKATLMAANTLAVRIRANMTTLECADVSRAIFKRNDGAPFPYLSGITIGSRVPIASVGERAFRGSKNLTSVVWNVNPAYSEGVAFGDYAFEGCEALTSLSWMPPLTSSVGIGCFKGCKRLVSLKGLVLTANEIPQECFAECTALQTFEGFPEDVTTIGVRAFAGCSALSNLDGLPDSITTLEDDCFADCASLTTLLYLPKQLEGIGNGSFRGCSALRALFIPESVTTIEDEAFQGCSNLTSIMCEAATPPTIQDGELPFDPTTVKIYVPLNSKSSYEDAPGWREYGNAMFEYGHFEVSLTDVPAGTSLLGTTGIVVSDSIWQVEYENGESRPLRFENTTTALPAHTYEESGSHIVKLTGYIREIGATSESYPFIATTVGGTNNLITEVDAASLPSLERFGNYCFALCPNLGEVSLAENETSFSLGTRTFFGCSALESTAFLNARENFGSDDAAFGEGCFYQSGIRTISYPKTYVTSLPAYCFAETSISNLDGITSASLVSLGEYCFWNNRELESIEGLSNTGITALSAYCFAECAALETLQGIEGITVLGEHVFEGCTSLTSIAELASTSISTIPAYTFAGCIGLTSLEGIPSGVISLGNHAFANCTGLTTLSALRRGINPPNPIKTIPAYCFENCSNLKTLVGCADVETIEGGAFAGCIGLLSSSGLGMNVKSIGAYAFENCYSLNYFSCLPVIAPTILTTTFSGVDIASLALYVREGAVESYTGNTLWNKFGSIESRSIKLHYENLEGISLEDVACTRIVAQIANGENAAIPGVWYVDYGDGQAFETKYAEDNQTSLSAYGYSTRGNYTITLFGDITELWSGDSTYNETSSITPEDADVEPFLGSLRQKASSIIINSPYLTKIGDFCFFNYGIEDSQLLVSLDLLSGGSIGAFAFAKKESSKNNGRIGTVLSCKAGTVNEFAFYKSGLESSLAFTNVVTAKKSSFEGNQGLLELLGFSSLEIIGDRAFANCTSLSATLGLSSAVSIGFEAFSGCDAITLVNGFTDSLKYIREEAFKGCLNIKTISLAIGVPPVSQDYDDESEYQNCTLADNVFESEVFAGATLYVPAGKEIDYQNKPYWSLFGGGEQGNRIKSRAITFHLERVTPGSRIVNGLAVVSATGPWTISYGEQQTLTFPAGDTALPAYTFSNVETIDIDIKISGPITSIYSTAAAYPIFGSKVGENRWLTGIESSEVMEVTSFGNFVFSGCFNLSYVHSAETVLSVGNSTFANDVNLIDVTGLSKVETIGESAFSGCSLLPSLYGLASVRTIGSNAFRGCANLRTIDGLGINVTEIGSRAFASCPLKEVQVFAEQPPTISADSFGSLDFANTALYVRTKSIGAYSDNANWGLFQNIRSRCLRFTLQECPANIEVCGPTAKVRSNTFWVVDWDEENYTANEGWSGDTYSIKSHTYEQPGNHTFYIEGDISEILSELDASAITLDGNGQPTQIEGYGFVGRASAQYLVSVEKSTYLELEEIGSATFLHNENLSTTRLGGVAVVGDAAFAYSGLSDLEVLGSISRIGRYAFFGCRGLSSVQNLSGQAISIGEYAFVFRNNTDEFVHPEFVQINIPYPQNARIWATGDVSCAYNNAFGYFSSTEEKAMLPVYVPIDAETRYRDALFPDGITHNPWSDFAVSSQVIECTLENVPSGITIIGLSASEVVGTTRIVSDTEWTIDWDDGSKNTMPASQTTFPAHTYAYDPNNITDAPNWTSRVVEGNTFWYRKKISIMISGAIKFIGCQSAADTGFLSTNRGEGCPYLTKITASETLVSLTTIGESTFEGCASLTSVSGFSHVTTIEKSAFHNCMNLVDLGSGDSGFKSVTVVGDYAFYNCESLRSLESFQSVLLIGVRAFAYCLSLEGTMGMGSTYRDYSIEDWDRLELVASFGSYAFDGDGFGIIYMENYQKPPKIMTTTFYGDPQNVIVRVSPAEGVEEAYRAADVWKNYFDNIIGAAQISLTIGAEEIHNGIAFCGENCLLAFRGSYLDIDWGDGSEHTHSTETSSNGWQFPNHYYTNDISGSVTIQIVGNITKLYTKDAGDQYPISNPKPAFALAPFEMVVDPETGASIPNMLSGRTYDFKIEELNFGSGSRLGRIGTYSFLGSNIGRIVFGKPSTWSEVDPVTGEIIQHEGSTEIGASAFQSCTYTTSITSEISALSSIGSYAFEGCNQIVSTGFLSGVKTIGVESFRGCSLLANTNGLTSVVTMGQGAFRDCVGLVGIRLPKTLESVPPSAFEGCSGIRAGEDGGIVWEQADQDSPLIDNENCIVGERAFANCIGGDSSSWSVVLPSQAHTIKRAAFYKCGMSTFSWAATWGQIYSLETGLSSDTMAGIFEGCMHLANILSIPALTTIPARAFCLCSSLTSSAFSVLVENAQGTLGDYAFAGCIALGDITIPSAISRLGEGCFNCSREAFLIGDYEWVFEEPETRGSPTRIPSQIGMDAFERWMTTQYGNLKIDVWEKYDQIAYVGESSNGPHTISWDRSSSTSGSIGAGCFMNCTQMQIADWGAFPHISELPAFALYNCRNIVPMGGEGNLSFLPSSILRFGRFALAGVNITSLGRGDASPIIATLMPALFMKCPLTSLGDGNDGLVNLFATVPASLPDACFYGCSSLTDISALRSAVPVTRLGRYSFAKCTGFTGQVVVGSATKDYLAGNLPNVTAIGEGCFKGCSNLAPSFTGLPKLEYYPYRAFAECGFTQINLNGIDGELYTTGLMLEGDAFIGCQASYVELHIPGIANVVAVSGMDEEAQSFVASDPFPSISIDVETGKKQAELAVAYNFIDGYMANVYWQSFQMISAIPNYYPPGPAPVADEVLSLTVNIPADGITFYLTGRIEIPAGGTAIINWGDSSEGSRTEVAYGAAQEEISHTYIGTGAARTCTIALSGDVRQYSGTNIVNDNYNHVGRPLFSTELPETESSGTINSSITSVNIAHDTVYGEQRIWIDTFINCTSLSQVTISTRSLTKIEAGAFCGCTALASILPGISPEAQVLGSLQNVKSLDNYAFQKTGFTDLLWMSACQCRPETLGRWCFDQSTLTSIEALPNSIISLGTYCFRMTPIISLNGMQNLGLDILPEGCFISCGQLTSIANLPPNLVSISAWCFSSCGSLRGFSDSGVSVLPAGLTHIEGAAFYGAGIQSLNGLDNILSIGDNAFYGTPLTSLAGLPSISAISSGCFMNCTQLVSLSSLPSSVTSLGANCFNGCTSLSSLSGITNVSSLGTSCFENTGIVALTGLDTSAITVLPDRCFALCTALQGLSGMGNNITSIGAECFFGCSHGNFTDLQNISQNLAILGNRAFGNCTSLTDLFGIQSTKITSLPPNCFQGCSSLTEIVCGQVGSETALGENIEVIGTECFVGCPIEYIRLARYKPDDPNHVITDLAAGVFDAGVYTSAEVYVPADALTTYENDTTGWGAFDHIQAYTTP